MEENLPTDKELADLQKKLEKEQAKKFKENTNKNKVLSENHIKAIDIRVIYWIVGIVAVIFLIEIAGAIVGFVYLTSKGHLKSEVTQNVLLNDTIIVPPSKIDVNTNFTPTIEIENQYENNHTIIVNNLISCPSS